jgi:hypothetical protein
MEQRWEVGIDSNGKTGCGSAPEMALIKLRKIFLLLLWYDFRLWTIIDKSTNLEVNALCHVF